jgi:S1-C subfamily serine protease
LGPLRSVEGGGDGFSMKKTLILCSISALLGAALVAAVIELPKAGSASQAQESQPRWPPSGGPNAPPMATVGPAPPWGITDPALELDELTPEERVNVAVYEKCNRSVVHITTQSVSIDSFSWIQTPREGEGSGSVIDRQGHIVTNYHVVEDAREIRVTLFDGNTYDAQSVGADRISDVAVLKIDAPAETLFPVEFGDSARLKVGQRVYAIGNPFGLDRTLSTGIISSLNRSLPSRAKYREMEQIIQIDAAINPGNSGGPLLDSRGRIIGMNTAIASSTGESAGVGFAIPVATLARVVPQLLRDGRVVRAGIGIAGVYEREQGLLIVRLVPGGAAERAGLRGPRTFRRRSDPFTYIDRSAADLITAIDGQPVRTVESFLSIIESRQPGEQVTVTVIRDGHEINVPVTLEAAE